MTAETKYIDFGNFSFHTAQWRSRKSSEAPQPHDMVNDKSAYEMKSCYATHNTESFGPQPRFSTNVSSKN